MTEIRNFCFLNKFLSGHNFCLLTSLVFHKRVNANIEKVCFNPEIYSSNPEVLKCDQDKHYWSSGHESYALKSSPWIPSVFQANVSLNDQSFLLIDLLKPFSRKIQDQWKKNEFNPTYLEGDKSQIPSKNNHFLRIWYFRMVFGTFLLLGRSDWANSFSIGLAFFYW